MPTPPNLLTLTTLAEGAAVEAFGAALERLMANLDDPNTEAKARREIVLKFRFYSDEDRRLGQVRMDVITALPGQRSVISNVYYGRHQGVLTAVSVPGQAELFPEPDARPRAVIGTKEGA